MPEIQVQENESIESALKRFRREIQKSGILSEIRRHEHYEKPSEKRKREASRKKKR
ncbi:MAG: 30S ribosomal protein S21 [bacterium]|nr:30S ribosomal protein S21 [bacterium]